MPIDISKPVVVFRTTEAFDGEGYPITVSLTKFPDGTFTMMSYRDGEDERIRPMSRSEVMEWAQGIIDILEEQP